MTEIAHKKRRKPQTAPEMKSTLTKSAGNENSNKFRKHPKERQWKPQANSAGRLERRRKSLTKTPREVVTRNAVHPGG